MGEILFGIIVGLLLAFMIANWLGSLLEKRLLNEQEQEESTAKDLKLEIEVHGDVLYAFNHETKDFVCQGSTVKQLKENLIRRYGQINASIVAGPEETLVAIQKQLLETKNENLSSQ